VAVVADVRAIEGVYDDARVAIPVVNATAAPVGIRSEVSDVDEGVTVGSDVAAGIDP
jgi:hypothetical protein